MNPYWTTEQGRWDRLRNYNFGTVFQYPLDDGDYIIIIEAVSRKGQPAYFAYWNEDHRIPNTWVLFKGPTSKRHVNDWWDLCTDVAQELGQASKKLASTWKNRLRYRSASIFCSQPKGFTEAWIKAQRY